MQASGDATRSPTSSAAIFQVGLRIALLRVDEVGELQRIAEEEHGRVVADHVPVAFFGVELQGEAARIALGVGRALFAADGGEAQEQSRSACRLRRTAWRLV